jgi:diadenosine tetraphosphate (Ap4A) HIT family hydrolase
MISDIMAKYNYLTKERKCVFCEIVKGNIKTPGIFWESRKYLAFLSTFPNTLGFTVLVPKKHFGSDVLAMPDKDLKEFIIAGKKVSKILMKHFDDVGRVGLIMEGTGIDHAHIKLIPMHNTKHMKKGIWKQYLSQKEEYFKKYEGYITSTEGPKADPKLLSKLADQLKKVKL